MTMAILPARGGSKRIPRKNIRPFAGRPMIAWPIAAARESGLYTRVIVSTDDDEIAEIARAEGAEVPFRRPPALSGDHTGTLPVIAHAVEALGATGPVTCIYPSAPFVQPSDLIRAHDLLSEGVEYVVPVASFGHPIERALRQTADGMLTMDDPERARTRTQDLPPAYHDAGQFYIGPAETFLAGRPILASRTRGFVLPRWRVVDIDTEEDWQQAELLFAAVRGTERSS